MPRHHCSVFCIALEVSEKSSPFNRNTVRRKLLDDGSLNFSLASFLIKSDSVFLRGPIGDSGLLF